MRQIWKPIPGYAGLYLISNFGKIRSLVPSSRSVSGQHILKASPSTHGYPMVALRKPNGTYHRATVSRLVLLTFIGHPPRTTPYALHNDGNPMNSRLDNLRWGSNSDNQLDRRRHNTSNAGERNAHAKLTEHDVIDIKRRMARGDRNKDIARDYPAVDLSLFSSIRTGRLWKHITI